MTNRKRANVSRRQFLRTAGMGMAGVAGAAMLGSNVASAMSPNNSRGNNIPRGKGYPYTIVTYTDGLCWPNDDWARDLIYKPLFENSKEMFGVQFVEKRVAKNGCCGGDIRQDFIDLRKQGYKFFLSPSCTGQDEAMLTPPEYPVDGTPSDIQNYYKMVADFIYAWSDACVLASVGTDTSALSEGIKLLSGGVVPMHHLIVGAYDTCTAVEYKMCADAEAGNIHSMVAIVNDSGYSRTQAEGMIDAAKNCGISFADAKPDRNLNPRWTVKEISGVKVLAMPYGSSEEAVNDALDAVYVDGQNPDAIIAVPFDPGDFGGWINPLADRSSRATLYGGAAWAGATSAQISGMKGLFYSLIPLDKGTFSNGQSAEEFNAALGVWSPDNPNNSWNSTYGNYGGLYYHCFVDAFLLLAQLMVEKHANVYQVNKSLQEDTFQTILSAESRWSGGDYLVDIANQVDRAYYLVNQLGQLVQTDEYGNLLLQ